MKSRLLRRSLDDLAALGVPCEDCHCAERAKVLRDSGVQWEWAGRLDGARTRVLLADEFERKAAACAMPDGPARELAFKLLAGGWHGTPAELVAAAVDVAG